MKRLKLYILIFCLFLSVPIGYLIFRTHQGLEQEEMAELRYFADTLFYEMEKALADFVLTEEARDIDAYTPGSELSKLPEARFILGYFQNNPDGSFQTPLQVQTAGRKSAHAAGAKPDPRKDAVPGTGRLRRVISELETDNQRFNTRRTHVPPPMAVPPPEKQVPTEKETDALKFAEKYLDLSRSKRQKAALGQEAKRVEEITGRQAWNLAKVKKTPGKTLQSERRAPAPAAPAGGAGTPETLLEAEVADHGSRPATDGADAPAGSSPDRHPADRTAGTGGEATAAGPMDRGGDTARFRVEIDPMQSVFLSDNKVMLFRRIVIDNQVFRQGMVILLNEFLNHLADTYFNRQPMAEFTRLELAAVDRERARTIVRTGAAVEKIKFALHRTFPRPFSFLRVSLVSDAIPSSGSRQTLTVMTVAMVMGILLGLFAIYHSARAVAETSKRRARFVSSVTHELKTPLTNIRMYIEMLEQKIAPTPEREREYYSVLGSESARLSRLVNNVLEFSRLEKKNRRLDLVAGDFSEVIAEVEGIMREKLRQEGFDFQVSPSGDAVFTYDREVMVQVMINLMENAVKFGKKEPVKKITLKLEPAGGWMHIKLSDTGPGIPRFALKKVFRDFFRADTESNRSTSGTGIGLALVHKFVTAMGGTVTVKNNDGPGCTFIIRLPMKNAHRAKNPEAGR